MGDASSTAPYWEQLTPTQELDFTFAFENQRFSDYAVEVTTSSAPVASCYDAIKDEFSQQRHLELDATPFSFETVTSASNGNGTLHEVSYGETSFRSATEDDEASGEPESQLFRVPVNSVIVSSKSLYFRRMIDSGQFESTRTLPLRIHRQELPSLMLAMRWLYGGSVRFEHIPLPDLGRLLLVADRLQVPSLVRATIQHCTGRKLTVEAATMFLDLPEYLEPLSFTLLDLCADFLEARFAHLDMLRLDDKLRAQFMRLSWRGLAVLLHSEKVSVQSENTVFILLQCWAKSQGLEQEAFHEEPHNLLLSSLRYAYMSQEFLNDKVAAAECMQCDTAHKLVNEAKVFRAAPQSFRERLVQDATHVRFQERPKPPPHVLELIDPCVGQQPELASAGMSNWLGGLLGCYLWGQIEPLSGTPHGPPPNGKAQPQPQVLRIAQVPDANP